MQRRTNTIVIACLLAVVAALLPLVAMLTLARQQATAEEQAHLADYAGWALQRAETTLAEAERTLVALEAEGWDGCSPAHIARMRQLTVDEPAIVEIGYLRDGRLHCTSWGQVDGIVREFEPDAELPGGFALAIGVRPAVSRSGPVLIIAHRSHNVLVPQSRLVDVPINKEATLGVALRGGRLLAVTGPAPRRRLKPRCAPTFGGTSVRFTPSGQGATSPPSRSATPRRSKADASPPSVCSSRSDWSSPPSWSAPYCWFRGSGYHPGASLSSRSRSANSSPTTSRSSIFRPDVVSGPRHWRAGGGPTTAFPCPIHSSRWPSSIT